MFERGGAATAALLGNCEVVDWCSTIRADLSCLDLEKASLLKFIEQSTGWRLSGLPFQESLARGEPNLVSAD